MTKTDSDNNIIKELDELISLAESSTDKIDALSENLDELNMRINLASVITAILGILAFIGLRYYSKHIFIQGNIFLAIALILLAIVGIFIYLIFYKTLRRIKTTESELAIERDVHNRLIAFLEDQMKRVKQIDGYSQLSLVTKEMRVRRLDRTGRKAN